MRHYKEHSKVRKITMVKLNAFLICFTIVIFNTVANAGTTQVWSDNSVSDNIASALSGVGLNSKANWSGKFKDKYESSNRTEDIQKIFSDGFRHFTYIVSLRYFFTKDCFRSAEYTVECIKDGVFDSKIESIKQQIDEVISSNESAVFVFSLKPSYKNLVNNSDGVKQTEFLKAFENSKETRDALGEIWLHISQVLKDIPVDNLVFNLINEPEWEHYSGWSAHSKWKKHAIDLVDIIRGVTPSRTIMVEGMYKGLFGKGSAKGVGNNGYDFGQRKYSGPSELITPIDRKNIVYGFHYYEPYSWTHQDSHWMSKGDRGHPLPSITRLQSDLEELVEFSNEYNVPVVLSEVGVNGSCDGNGPKLEERAKYASVVYETLVENGVGVTWWSLEDPNMPYKRDEKDCYTQRYRDLIPENKLFKALRLN